MLFAFKNLKIPIENFKMLKDKCQKYNNVIIYRFFVYNAYPFSLWSVARLNAKRNKFRRSYRLLLVRTAHPSFSRKSFSRTSLNRRVVSALSNAATKKKQSKRSINLVRINNFSWKISQKRFALNYLLSLTFSYFFYQNYLQLSLTVLVITVNAQTFFKWLLKT